MINIFDKIVCLVLDRQLAEVTIHKELAKFGWEVEFFVAGNGITVSPERYNYIDEKVEGRSQAYNYAKCLQSITKEANDKGLQNFLFCEADCLLKENFTTIFPKAIEEINNQNILYDMLFIGGNHVNGRNIKISDHIIKPEYSLDLHCVVFNWTIYDIILNLEPSAYATFDGKLANLQKNKLIDVFAINPSIATQKSGFSYNENRIIDRSVNHGYINCQT